VKDKEKFKQFRELISWSLYSRDEFNYARKKLERGNLSDIERAAYFFLIIRQSFAGQGEVWGYEVETSKQAKDWFNLGGLLREVHKRLANVQIENEDFRNIIPRYDREDTFFYLDPPYYPLTYSVGLMKYPLSVEDYDDLFYLLLNIKGKVLLSGFPHPVYKVLEDAGWQRIDIKRAITLSNPNRTGGKRSHKIESLWFNYELPNGGDVK
jgi:DNA adenine methylase